MHEAEDDLDNLCRELDEENNDNSDPSAQFLFED